MTASWERAYPVTSANPNLTVEIVLEGQPLYVEKGMLEIYEERPNCERFYLGTVYLQSGSKDSVTLPMGKDLIIFFVKRSRTLGSVEESDDSIRLVVSPDEKYRVSFRERNGSQEIKFEIKRGSAQFQAWSGIPKKTCQDFKVLNLK